MRCVQLLLAELAPTVVVCWVLQLTPRLLVWAAQDALKPKELKREEWMLKPPEHVDALASASGSFPAKPGRTYG